MVLDAREKLYTVDEFEQFIALPENDDRLFELIDGEIVEKMPTEEHAVIAARMIIRMGIHVEPNQLGRIAVEPRHRMPDDDHNARLPDIAFTSAARLKPVVKKGAVPHMPDLAIEIKSPTDSLKKLLDKAAYYLANGVRLVWLLIPEKRMVIVLTADSEDILTEADTLDGGDVLPDFKLAVKDIFAV